MNNLTYDELMSKIELTKSILNNPSDDELISLFPLYKTVILLRKTGFSKDDVKLTFNSVKPAPVELSSYDKNYRIIEEELDNDPIGTRALVYALDMLLNDARNAPDVKTKDNLLRAIQETIWNCYNKN